MSAADRRAAVPDPGALPAAGECHLWLAEVGRFRAPRLLEPAERSLLASFRSPAAAARYLASRAAQRMLLARYLGRPTSEIVINRVCTLCRSAEHGRPWVERGPDYSASRTEAFIALAVHAEGAIGIDIETLRPELADPEVARMAMSSAERAAAADGEALDREAPAELFLRLWCRKEALLKAVGIGLLRDPATVDTSTGHVVIEGQSLEVIDVPAPEGHRMAVAWEARGPVTIGGPWLMDPPGWECQLDLAPEGRSRFPGTS